MHVSKADGLIYYFALLYISYYWICTYWPTIEYVDNMKFPVLLSI